MIVKPVPFVTMLLKLRGDPSPSFNRYSVLVWRVPGAQTPKSVPLARVAAAPLAMAETPFVPNTERFAPVGVGKLARAECVSARLRRNEAHIKPA